MVTVLLQETEASSEMTSLVALASGEALVVSPRIAVVGTSFARPHGHDSRVRT